MQANRGFVGTIVVITLLAAIPQAAWAGFGEWDSPVTLDETHYQVAQPDVAMSESGYVITVWRQYDPATYWRIASRERGPDGVLGGLHILDSSPIGDTDTPQVAARANGNAVAVWTAFNGSGWGIWSADYIAGVGWTAEAEIDGTSDSATQPAVAIDAGGNTTVAFQTDDTVHLNAAAVRRPAGGAWGPHIGLEFSGSNAGPPKVIAGKGTTAIIWYQAESPSTVNVAICEPGNCWQPAVSFGNSSNIARLPQGAVDAQGVVHFAWVQNNGTVDHIHYRTYTPAVGWSVPVRVDGFDGPNSDEPAIAVSGDVEVTVVYTVDLAGWAVVAVQWAPAAGWSPPTILAYDPSLFPSGIRAVADKAGAVAVTWQSEFFDTFSWINWYGVFTSRFDPVKGWSAGVELSPEESQDAPTSPRLAAGAGSAWAVWSLSTASTTSIKADHYTFPDHVKPALTVSAPVDRAVTTVPSVRVEGQTEPSATVFVNGVGAQVLPDGRFGVLIALSSGINDLTIVSTDTAGNVETVELTVTFNDPVPGLLASLAATQTNLSSTKATLAATQGQLAETQARLAVVTADLTQAQADLASAEANVTGLQSDVNATEVGLAAAQANVTAAKARLASAEANVTAAVAASVAAQSAAASLAANLTVTKAELSNTQDDVASTNLELDKTKKDLDASNANIVSLTGQLGTATMLAVIALLAAIAGIGLSLVMARRGGGGGGGGGVLRNAGEGVPNGSAGEGQRGASVGAPKKSFASRSAAGGEVGSGDDSGATAPGVRGAAQAGEDVAGGGASLGSETSHAEAPAGISEQ